MSFLVIYQKINNLRVKNNEIKNKYRKKLIK